MTKTAQADVLYHRGNTLAAAQQFQAALESFDAAIALDSTHADAHNNRGAMLRALGQSTAALASFDRALALKPQWLAAIVNRAVILEDLRRWDEALSTYDQVIAAAPDYAEAYFGRGNVFYGLRRHEEALANFDDAVARAPAHARAHTNRGAVLRDLGRYDEALASFDHAVALGYGEAFSGRGLVLQDMQRYDDALASYEQALARKPGFVDAQWNKSLLKLLLGDYAAGWPLYESRWQTPDVAPFTQGLTAPQWHGEGDIAGKTIFLYAEQGLGDAIQFCRYLPMVAALGARVVFESPKPVLSLMEKFNGPSIEVIPRGRPRPPCDLQCSLLSLPLAFKTTLATIPRQVPYLVANPRKVSEWQRKLGPRTKPRVGIAWSGNPMQRNDRMRSLSVTALLPILSMPVEFHCLQKEIRPQDISQHEALGRVIRHDADLKDFGDTAALATAMDFVISSDTAVAHLVGAIGKELWLMLYYAADFRWLTARDDSPWYSTARLFRQQTIGDWTSVIGAIAQALLSRITG